MKNSYQTAKSNMQEMKSNQENRNGSQDEKQQTSNSMMLKQKPNIVKQLNSLRYPALEMQGKGAVLNTSRGFKTR